MVETVEPGASFSGTTLNERLYLLGTLDTFASAARRRDAQAMRTLLQEAQLFESDAARCVDTILADPKKYGY